MTIEAIKDQLPEYARDVRLNLSSILTEEGSPDLTQKQIDGVALASAYTTRNKPLISAIFSEVKSRLDEAEVNAAKAAASIMAMNNIYYRFTHLVSDKEYSSLPAKLRMNIIGKPGIPKVDFELYSLAASVINGCGMCIEAHAHSIINEGLTKVAVQSAARIAAVINSAAIALEIAEVE